MINKETTNDQSMINEWSMNDQQMINKWSIKNIQYLAAHWWIYSYNCKKRKRKTVRKRRLSKNQVQFKKNKK